MLSITAVLNPMVTVALARIHLVERVARVQRTGSVMTMLGVLLVLARKRGRGPSRPVSPARSRYITAI